ncbi:helix-turn-helix transcriptional regulator [Kribbella sp. DT2]|uniref:helix-turn-helix transcriptional regulator n=1 Tax=Kribbella sp. DT2 TaxID=3393427 RepID=UPI003CEE14BB
MTRPTSRVLALLELLQGGGTRRVADLAERLGVDERTVRRYAEHLLDLDIPVRSIRGRYGGYRLAPGYRMPPLMLTDDEAVALAIGLVVGRRAGLVPESTASESALAKLRRVLPVRLADRLGALLATSSFTAPPRSATPTDTGILLTIAEAARDRLTVELTYTDRHGRTSTRTISPYGVVGHAGHWYVTATATATAAAAAAAATATATGPRPGPTAAANSPRPGPTADATGLPARTPDAERSGASDRRAEHRTFRLDRITSAKLLTATTEPAPGIDPMHAVRTPGVDPAHAVRTPELDPARAVLESLATAPWTHHVSVRVQGSADDIQRRLPLGLAIVTPSQPHEVRVEFRAERLDWVPALLAGFDLPFVIEEPPELRKRVADLAQRLAAWADA